MPRFLQLPIRKYSDSQLLPQRGHAAVAAHAYRSASSHVVTLLGTNSVRQETHAVSFRPEAFTHSVKAPTSASHAPSVAAGGDAPAEVDEDLRPTVVPTTAPTTMDARTITRMATRHARWRLRLWVGGSFDGGFCASLSAEGGSGGLSSSSVIKVAWTRMAYGLGLQQHFFVGIRRPPTPGRRRCFAGRW